MDKVSNLINQIVQCGVNTQYADSECHAAWIAQGCTCIDDFHLPEPWNGNIESASLLFLSINPGYSPNELYPRMGNGWWIDERGELSVQRVADFFTNRFSSVHNYVKNEDGRCFCIKLEDGTYRRLRRSYWENIHKIATLILNRDVCIGKDYAISEIVHCKTSHENDLNEKCYSRCLTLWLTQILNVAQKVNTIVVVGNRPRILIGQFVEPRIDVPERYRWYERSVPGGRKYKWLFIDHPAAYQCNPVARVSELYESLTPKPLRWWNRNKANDQPRGEARKMRESDRDKKQLYKNLWNGFCNWCKQNAKRWYTVSLGPDHSTNSIHPSGGGNPHLFFKVANGQLYLGLYCTVSMYEEIQTRCAEEINAVYDDVDWTNGEDKKTWRSILIPINEDWRNPNEALFEKMSDAFERVGSILKRHGFNIKM